MKKYLFILLYFIVITLLITFPLIFHLADRLPGLGDELLMTWIMNWNIHAFFTDPLHIFQANIFYPYANTLAYSDVFFTSSIIGFLPYLVLLQPAVLYNVTLLFSLTTVGFFTYLLVFQVTKNIPAGILSGTLIAFSSFTLSRLPVLQLIGIEWIPLSLLFFNRYLEKKDFPSLVLTAVFFIIQIYNSFLPAYFLLFCYGSIFLVYLFQKKVTWKHLVHRSVLLVGIVTLGLIIPLGLPYFAVSKEFAYSRDIRDAIHFGNRPEYSLYPSDRTRLEGLLLKTFYAQNTGPYSYSGYIGLTCLSGLFYVLIYRFFLKKKSPGTLFTAFSVIGIGAYLLSLGPAFQWGGHVLKFPFIIPLPYALAYYLVPGFNGMRNSGRWEFLAVFALAVLIGLVFTDAMKKKSLRVQYLIVGIISLLTIFEYSFPLPLKPVAVREDFPPIYREITKLPMDRAIIELPLYSWRMAPYANQEFLREYYSTEHYKRMVNGYSGFSPIPWEQQADFLMLSFPNKAALERLRRLHISYLVLHQDEYIRLEKANFRVDNTPVATWKYVSETLRNNPEVRLKYQHGDVFMYELL